MMWDASFEELIADFEQHICSNEDVVFLYVLADKTVGFAHCCLRMTMWREQTAVLWGYLEGVLVEEEYREQGIAKALVNACERWAAEMGCTEFASDCELDNAESLAFHLNIGFDEKSRSIHFAKKL